jgi:hypothetical protein
LAQLLLDFNWLEAKLNATNVHELIADYGFVSVSPPHSLIESALQLSSHVVRQDPGLLAGKLKGRLHGLDEADPVGLVPHLPKWIE